MFSSETQIEKKYNAAIYIRLSKDDGDKMESNSISNQRTLIESFLKNRPEITVRSERVDDGYSGVTFDRPAVKAMLEDIKAGSINCVIVKDLSRFGRNYIETGRYIEQVFPFMGVRFIAINDGFDSANQQSQADGMIIPFKNLINDAYSRDISIKVRSQLNTRCKQGDYIGAFPLYGYFRSEEDRHKLEIDTFAAMTIRDIFKWKIEGMSNQRIAEKLNGMGILSPLEYKRMLGWAYSTTFKLQPVAKWSAGTVLRILKNEVYTGTMIQGKESSPNYKIKKKLAKPRSEWIIVPDKHEPIINKEEFDLVRRLMLTDTRTAPENGSLYTFSGMLECGHCKHSMIRKPVKSDGKSYVYYVCRTQKTDKSKCDGKCRIAEPRLKESVLKLIQAQIHIVCTIDEILQYINTLPLKQMEVKKVNLRIKKKREEYEQCKKQSFELYNDYKKGVVSKKNYLIWKVAYEENVEQIAEAIKILETELSILLKNCTEKSKWIEEFKRFKGITELTRPILIALVRKIEVVDKQTIRIHYTYKDEFESALRLIEKTVKMNMLTKEQCKDLLIGGQEVV